MNDSYTTTAKTIPGYTLVTTPTNNQGNFGTSDITVDYVYKAEDYTLTSTYKDAQGKELKQPVVDSKKISYSRQLFYKCSNHSGLYASSDTCERNRNLPYERCHG